MYYFKFLVHEKIFIDNFCITFGVFMKHIIVHQYYFIISRLINKNVDSKRFD